MTDRSADILPADQSIGSVSDQLTGIPLHFPARRRWLAAMIFASALLLCLSFRSSPCSRGASASGESIFPSTGRLRSIIMCGGLASAMPER